MKEEKNCPWCPNHCDVDRLSCGRGREYFKSSSNEEVSKSNHHFEKDESSMTEDEKVLLKLRKCGHYLHHSENPIDLNFLEEEEKQNLVAILSKCLENWESKKHK